MSLILAIETSHPRGSVAVVRDGVVIFEQTFTSERSHNSQLFAPLAEALKIGGGDLKTIVVGLGPGSYTGARIGIAAAQGVALSRNVPVIGLPSVLALETENLPREFMVCGDARRGKFFIARTRDGMLEGEITLHDGDELLQHQAQNAAVSWFSFDAKPPLNLANITLTTPSGSRLALLASGMTDETIWTLEQQVLEPHYLAAPFVTKARV
jgi:tRNA threonylcarbamoyl adenosine modification protein YeaZ